VSSEVLEVLVEAANSCKTLKVISIAENPELKGKRSKFREDIDATK
jgi:hypothetical protein